MKVLLLLPLLHTAFFSCKIKQSRDEDRDFFFTHLSASQQYMRTSLQANACVLYLKTT